MAAMTPSLKLAQMIPARVAQRPMAPTQTAIPQKAIPQTARALIASALTLAALATPLTAQKHARWLEDLGDEQKSEAAERSLIAMGPKALVPLTEQLGNWDTSTERERVRCIALLRVVRLLGETAAPLAPDIKSHGMERDAKLIPEIADTLATLEPYANDNAWHELFHHSAVGMGDEKGRAMRAFIRNVARHHVKARGSFEQLKETLLRDEFGTREVCAEAFAKLGNKDAIDLLHRRLLDRDTKPKNSDQLKHNGWTVPIEDEFALQAGKALVKLAPSDPRAAIGYANLALHHPHRSVRLESIRQMAQLGPAAADAIPELMEIASGDDAAMALEALKLLGMAGKDVGKNLLAIDALAAKGDGPAARVAKGLAARLRAMGCEPPAPDAEALAREARLDELDKALDNAPSAEVLAEIAANKDMWPRLSARLRKDRAGTPDLIFDLISKVGWLRSEDERTEMGYRIALLTGTYWSASMMSSSSGGRAMSDLHHVTHARLNVDPKASNGDLITALKDDNPFVREVAAQILCARSAEWANDNNDYFAVHEALVAAATGKHPSKFKVQRGRNRSQKITKDRSLEVRCAAAEALSSCTVPDKHAAYLLTTIKRSQNEALVVQAIKGWAVRGPDNDKVLEALVGLAKDDREAVAAAAKAATNRLDGQ